MVDQTIIMMIILPILLLLSSFDIWHEYIAGWSSNDTYQQIINENNVTGPLFISLDTPDKLDEFVRMNPTVPRNRIFVEDFQTMEIYDHLGFDQFGLGKDDTSNLDRVQIPLLNSIGQC